MTAEQTAVFCMTIPHLDSYGKLIGEPAYIKEVALPFAPWATLEVIEDALKAINKHTSVKWFRHKDGRRYLHAVQFERHQQLEKDKRGADLLPSYPRIKSSIKSPTKSSTKSPTESEDSRARSGSGSEVEVKEEKKEEVKAAAARPLAFDGQAASSSNKGGSNGDDTPTASWKGSGVKESALNEVARMVSTGEIDLAGASDKLRLFNFTPSEINEPALMALLQRAAEGGAT